MKRLIKRVVKKVWNLTAPVRRPIARRVDTRLTRLMAQAIQSSQASAPQGADLGPHFEASNQAFFRVEYSLGAMHAKVDRYSTEIDLVLNSLVREIARLQLEVEELRGDLERATHQRPSGLSLVDGLGDEGQRIARVG